MDFYEKEQCVSCGDILESFLGISYEDRLKKKKNVDTDGERVLWLHRHLIGCNDDILDMAVLNPPNESRDDSNDDDDNIGNPHCGLKFAVVTNSAQVRLMDGNNFECVSLNGHSDIVLAIDATPDG